MKTIEPTLQHTLPHEGLPGVALKAGDLDFYTLLRRQAEDNALFFNQRRAAIFDVEALGALRQQLIETLGEEQARSVLIRFGYAQGYQDAGRLGENFHWATEGDWLAAGFFLQMLAGLVQVEPRQMEFNRETGHFLMSGTWRNSYEAEEYLKRYGPGSQPVCWSLAGYASGYASRFFGQELLVVETQCMGKGAECCHWEARPVSEWGPEAEPYLQAQQKVNTFNELVKANEQLREQADQLRKLSRAVEQSANTIVITNTQGYIEYANPKFVETTGYTLAEAIGQHTRILKSGVTSPEEYKRMWELIAAGHEWRGEFHNKKKTGELYWELASISPIKNAAGEITHYLAVKEEITERKLAEQALAERAAELEAVAEVSIAISTVLDASILLYTVADLVKERFNLYHAHIYVLNESGDMLNLTAGAGVIGEQMVAEGWSIPLARKQSLVARAARTRQGVVENNVREAPDWLPNPLLPETRSELAAPMMVGEALLGVLDVQSDKFNHFTDKDIHILTTLSTQVAVALQNVRLYAETAQRAIELEMLGHVSRRLSAVLDPKQLISEVVEQVGEAFNYYYTQIYLFDQFREHLVLAGGTGEVGRLLLARRHSLPKGRGLVGRAAEQNKIILAPDVERHIGVEIITQANLENVYRREVDPAVEAEWYAQYINRRFSNLKAMEDWLDLHPDRAGQPLKIGYVSHSPDIFPQMIRRGVEAAARDLAVEVELAAPARESEHLPLFEAMVRQGKDGLIVVPDRPNWVEPIRQALAAHIPVVTSNRDLKSTPALMHVGVDNFQAGVIMAREVVKLLEAAGLRQGKFLASTGIADRNEGVRHGLRDTNYTLVNIEAVLEEKSDESFMKRHWEQAINSQPDLVAVLALSGGETLALTEIKRQIQGRWLLAGFDLEPTTLEAIRDGIMQVTLGQHPYLQGYLPILALVEHLRYGKYLRGWMAEGWLPNSLLPETKTEVAVPIVLGDQVLGVLDVQHNVPNSLKPENASLLLSVADQIAVALQNATLFEQAQQTGYLLAERVKELDCLNDIGREAEEATSISEFLQWVTERVPAAMRYPDECVVAIEFDGQVYGKPEAINLTQQMVQGLRVGGKIVGRIYIAYTKKEDFINEESMFLGGIGRRVSAYIESRQLFEQLQERAYRELLLREITTRIRNAADADTILRITAKEVGRALKRPTFVYLGQPDKE